MTAPDPVRVLVVDDQELVRTGFCVILEGADGITVVAEAANGAEAVRAAAEHQTAACGWGQDHRWSGAIAEPIAPGVVTANLHAVRARRVGVAFPCPAAGFISRPPVTATPRGGNSQRIRLGCRAVRNRPRTSTPLGGSKHP
jgi:CheY-like chemotaxis protein